MTWSFIRSISIRSRCLLLIGCVLLLAGCSSSAERAQSHYENGVTLLKQHQNQKAAIEFKNAISLKRDMLPAWRGLAEIEEGSRHWQALIPILQEIVQLDAHDSDAKLKLARLLLLGGASDQALALVNGIEPSDATGANVKALRAAIFYKLKDNKRAAEQAQEALALDPSNVDAIMVIAATRFDDGDVKGAQQTIDSIPAAHANELGVQLYKLKIFEKLADSANIEATLKKLIALFPDKAAFRKQLVTFYIDQQRMNDAEAELRKAALQDGKDAVDAELDLIRFLYKVKGAAAARQELNARIATGGDTVPYKMALADLDYAQGNLADAAKSLDALANDPASPDHGIAAKIKLAEINLRSKNIDAADAILADVLRQDARNTSALKLRAAIRLDRGQVDAAIADLREILAEQPRATDVMLQLAAAYERGGAIELAEKQSAEAFRVSGFDPAVGLSYVAFLRRRGQLGRAEDILTDLASGQPKNLAVLSALADVKLARHDWVGAQEIGDAIRRLGENNGLADQVIGAALDGQQKFDESIAAFQSAVAASPYALQPMVLLVRALVRANQVDRAKAFLQAVLKANPANAEAHVLLGSIALSNGAPDQAFNEFSAAIDKEPKASIGYRALADFYLKQNKPNEALFTLRAGLDRLPDDIVLQMATAGVLERIGNYEGAISAYERILTRDPGSLIAINNLASLLADHRTDKASLERAQALAAGLRQSQVPQFQDTLGWLDYRRGDVKAAVPLLEQAATALPSTAQVRYHLAMAYVTSGQDKRASQEFEAALRLTSDAGLKQAITTEMSKLSTQ
jgi:tetratricopeptide (TPR) repeat protein